MARYRRGKVPFYEVMTKGRYKHGYSKTLGKLHPEKADEDETSEEKSDVEVPVPGISAKWWRKPRAVQFNASRIEFSMPYPIAAALVLGIILLILLAFRAGQYYSFLSEQGTSDSLVGDVSGNPQEEAAVVNSGQTQMQSESQKLSPSDAKVESAKPTGNNVIVLVEYRKRADLVPVQKHFAQYGIEIEIVNWGGKYFLITKDRYENFGPGTNGYKAKQNIIEVGAQYKGKSPDGYETFAPRFFRDAYGKKVE